MTAGSTLASAEGVLGDTRTPARSAGARVLGSAVDCYAALGQLAVANGNLKAARKMLREAEKLDPKNERTLRLARHFGTKAIAEADRVWDERGLTDQDMETWLHG